MPSDGDVVGCDPRNCVSGALLYDGAGRVKMVPGVVDNVSYNPMGFPIAVVSASARAIIIGPRERNVRLVGAAAAANERLASEEHVRLAVTIRVERGPGRPRPFLRRFCQ